MEGQWCSQSVNVPTVRGSQEEASQLFVEHSPWGGRGEREVRVPPDVVGLRTGFKSSTEIKCWTKNPTGTQRKDPNPPVVRERVRSKSRLLCSVGPGQEAEITNVFLPWSCWLQTWAGQNLQEVASASGALRR